MCIGSAVVRKCTVVCIGVGMTARRNLGIPAMLTGIADKTVRFLTRAAISTPIGTGNRLCVFFVGFLNIRRFEVVRTGMFTVGTGHRA